MTRVYEVAGGCPACGEEAAAVVADREAIRDEVEQLWTFQLGRVAPGLPAVRLADRLYFSQGPPLQVVRCHACGLLYRDPRERERFLTEAYAEEAVDAAMLGELGDAQRGAFAALADRLTRITGGAGRGLEIGSYTGAFLAVAAARGWSFRGLDVNADVVDLLRARGFEAEVGDGADVGAAVAQVDAVAIWNCFEQLPDPRRTLVSARASLRPGGVLALRVPSGACWLALRRRLDGPLRAPARAVLAHHNLLGFPYRHGFTPRSLCRLVRRCGFRVVRLDAAGVLPVPRRDEGLRATAERRAAALLPRALPRSRSPWLELYARRTD